MATRLPEGHLIFRNGRFHVQLNRGYARQRCYDDVALAAMYNAGVKVDTIARRLGITRQSVQLARKRLNLIPRNTGAPKQKDTAP